jgi:ribosomal protein S27E
MLSSKVRAEILTKLSQKIGYPVNEQSLPVDVKRGISILVAVEKDLSVIQEIYRAERGRVRNSLVLSLSARIHTNKEDTTLLDQITKLRADIETKLTVLANRIVTSEISKETVGNSKIKENEPSQIIELKCPKCGAPLPTLTSNQFKCSYCGATLVMGDLTVQLSSMVSSI